MWLQDLLLRLGLQTLPWLLLCTELACSGLLLQLVRCRRAAGGQGPSSRVHSWGCSTAQHSHRVAGQQLIICLCGVRVCVPLRLSLR